MRNFSFVALSIVTQHPSYPLQKSIQYSSLVKYQQKGLQHSERMLSNHRPASARYRSHLQHNKLAFNPIPSRIHENTSCKMAGARFETIMGHVAKVSQKFTASTRNSLPKPQFKPKSGLLSVGYSAFSMYDYTNVLQAL